jgi:hypothetical protein
LERRSYLPESPVRKAHTLRTSAQSRETSDANYAGYYKRLLGLEKKSRSKNP